MFLTDWRNDLEKCNSLSVNSSSRLVYTNTTWETTNHGSSHAGKGLEETNRKWLSTDLLLRKLMPLMLGAYTPYTNRSLISKWYKIILFTTFFTSPGVSADLMCQVLHILSIRMQAIKRGHQGEHWIRWKRFYLWKKKKNWNLELLYMGKSACKAQKKICSLWIRRNIKSLDCSKGLWEVFFILVKPVE